MPTDNVEITTTYTLNFAWRDDPHAGFGFPCDEKGIVDESALQPNAVVNYRKCVTGEYDVVAKGVEKYVHRVRLCSCGSGEYPEAIYDARDIFIANTCSKCHAERTGSDGNFRIWIKDNPK